MTVSIGFTFQGDTNTPKHRQAIADIKKAVEVVLGMNGAKNPGITISETVSQNQDVTFPEGQPTRNAYESRAINMWVVFHINEPTPTPEPQQAPAPTDSASTVSQSEAPAAPVDGTSN